MKQKSKMLGFKLIVSHLSIAFMGAVFLILSLLFHESLSNKIFNLVLDSSPRVEYLNNISTNLKSSHAELLEEALFKNGTPEHRQSIWRKEIWTSLDKLEQRSKRQWNIQDKNKKLNEIKSLLSEIYVQQWKIEDIANTSANSQATYILQSQALPQAKNMEHHIEALIFLLKKQSHTIITADILILFMELRLAINGSLSALERIGYAHEIHARVDYEHYINEFEFTMKKLKKYKSYFTPEMLDIFKWLKLEEKAYIKLEKIIENSTQTITEKIFNNYLNPLDISVFKLLNEITKELKEQLDRDTQNAIEQSNKIMWISRILVILMMIFAIYMAIRGSRNITNPLAKLNEAAQDFTSGKLSNDIKEEGSIELKTLSHTFNTMRHTIEENISLITSVLETAPDGILITNESGQIESFNSAAEDIFGWKSLDILGKDISILLPLKDRNKNNIKILKKLSQKKSNLELNGLKIDNTTFPMRLSISSAKVNDKQIYTIIATDISEQNKIQATLIAAKDKAEAANRAKAAFTANMSHEIRTPMNAVIGFAEVVLQDISLSKETKTHVGTILNSAKALLGIINDILDSSKLESGKFTLETICFHLPNLINDTLHTLRFQSEEKNISLEVNYNETLPVRVMGDPTRLRQIILNLVGNAIKFTEKGSILLSVKASKDLDMFSFAIADTGIGMSKEQTKKVFDSYTQADDATTRRFGGTGLGTTISKQIVELMDGKIWADSTLNKGSTFYFDIKMLEADPSIECLYENSSIIKELFSPRLFHILLAEDLKTNATLIMLRLKNLGHTIEWVDNGKKAVEAYKPNKYDLILMDVQMPELDGIEATKAIRELEKHSDTHLSILALTASVMDEDIHKCLKAGMDEIASKPIDMTQLLNTMEKIIPKNLGTSNSMHEIPLEDTTTIDFSPLNNVIDYEKALQTWQDSEVYLDALISFAKQRANSAKEIERLLFQKNCDTKNIKKILHALNGLSGNLGMTSLYNTIISISSDIKCHRIKEAKISVNILHDELQNVVEVINKLNNLKSETNVDIENVDIETKNNLISDLKDSLKSLDLDKIEASFNKLSKVISKNDLQDVNNAIDIFDFEAAENALKNIKIKE